MKLRGADRVAGGGAEGDVPVQQRVGLRRGRPAERIEAIENPGSLPQEVASRGDVLQTLVSDAVQGARADAAGNPLRGDGVVEEIAPNVVA